MGDAEMERKQRQKRKGMKTGKEQQLETNHTKSKPQKYSPPVNPDTHFQYVFTNLAA